MSTDLTVVRISLYVDRIITLQALTYTTLCVHICLGKAGKKRKKRKGRPGLRQQADSEGKPV